MKENKFAPLLNTTGGVIGKKAGVIINEVTDQAAAAGIGFGTTIGRSRLLSAIGGTAMNVITSDKNKDALTKALRKGSEIANTIGDKVVPVEVKIAIENDKASLRDRLKACEIDDTTSETIEEQVEEDYYEVHCFNCDALLGGADSKPAEPPFCGECAGDDDCTTCPDVQRCWDNETMDCTKLDKPERDGDYLLTVE